MALAGRSLFSYSITIGSTNQWLDFKTSGGGTQYHAQVAAGVYSPGQLTTALQAAIRVADPTDGTNITVSITRTASGNTGNRIVIATAGAFLSLLNTTGTNAGNSIAATLGHTTADETGALTYTGTSTCGTTLATALAGYNYSDDNWNQQNFGSVNISASGIKEAITFPLQKFFEVEYMYEQFTPTSVATTWRPLFQWMIAQKPFDFTPDYENSPNTVYAVTLETSSASGQGLGFKFTEMLPLAGFFKTGPLKMRLIP